MKNPINCFIIDDNIEAALALSTQVEQITSIKIKRIYNNPFEALNELILDETEKLIFLEGSMETFSAIKIAEQLRRESNNIIFTTSSHKMAVEAFKVRAKHFLLKPFTYDDLLRVITDVLEESILHKNIKKHAVDDFFLRTNSERGTLTKVSLKDIIYFQGANNHLHIYTLHNNYSVYYTLTEMEERIEHTDRFYRVHKSYMINVDFLIKIVGNRIDLEKYSVLMSDQYKKQFIDYIQKNTLVSKRLSINKRKHP